MTEHNNVAAAGEPEGTIAPCFVRHEDTGGQYERPATMKVHGLNFCEAHGEEARIGASLREHYEAFCFFERFDSPHAPPIEGLVGRELEAVAARVYEEGPSDEDHSRALKRAYKDKATRLVEVLELERESLAAQAACTLELDAEREALPQ